MLVQQVRDLTNSAEFEHHNTSLRLPLGLEAPVMTPNGGVVLFFLTTIPSLSNPCKNSYVIDQGRYNLDHPWQLLLPQDVPLGSNCKGTAN